MADERAAALPLRADIRRELERIAPEASSRELDDASRHIVEIVFGHLGGALTELAKVI